MDAAQEALARLDAETRRFRRTSKAHDKQRDATVAAVVAALRAGALPTDVADHSPFSDRYVRNLARAHGLGPRRKGMPPGAEAN
jgi:hypothetical protein